MLALYADTKTSVSSPNTIWAEVQFSPLKLRAGNMKSKGGSRQCKESFVAKHPTK